MPQQRQLRGHDREQEGRKPQRKPQVDRPELQQDQAGGDRDLRSAKGGRGNPQESDHDVTNCQLFQRGGAVSHWLR